MLEFSTWAKSAGVVEIHCQNTKCIFYFVDVWKVFCILKSTYFGHPCKSACTVVTILNNNSLQKGRKSSGWDLLIAFGVVLNKFKRHIIYYYVMSWFYIICCYILLHSLSMKEVKDVNSEILNKWDYKGFVNGGHDLWVQQWDSNSQQRKIKELKAY